MMTNKGIYVHLPFCESKCVYCNFASFVAEEDVKKRYIQSLIQEIKQSEGGRADTIYIGGGTPSCLNPVEIENILNAIREKYNVTDGEISMECNPNSVNEEKLKFYKKIGINRLSFGVQSLDDDALKEIGRLHTGRQALEALTLAKKVGFENINADLLIGHPTKHEVLEDAKVLTKLVTHISAYMLEVEEGTQLFERVKNNPFYLPSEDESVDAYNALAKFLEEQGFARYEISNFAKEGFECKHNLKYWSGEEYIGFGLSAHSFEKGVRRANSKNLDEYLARQSITTEVLSIKEKIEEKIMLGLRSRVGVDKSELKTLGYDIEKKKDYRDFLEKGIVYEKEKRFYLNPQFYGISNYVIIKLIM